MSGVQQDVTCPQCREPEACFTEYETRTGEEWELCRRCGYDRRLIIIRDRRKIAQIKAEIRKLVREDKVKEALNLAGCGSCEELEHFLKEKHLNFFKRTKGGYCIHREYRRKGYGAYRVMPKGGGIGTWGPLRQKEDVRRKQIEHLLSIRDQYEVKITEVLADGAIKEY